ncbi:MAG: phosphoenolpyruvate--protein phosphotransferase [Planctomycetes bacterium]|nr:phosphoenolpyruvate--protein phosphotransferase [Planctomycetota bacterium]
MSERILQGEAISPGTARGSLHFPGRSAASARPAVTSAQSASEEIERFHHHVAALSDEIEQSVADLENEALAAEAQIMRAHLAMLRDPEFHRQVHELVRATRYAAEVAAEHVLRDVAAALRASESPTLVDRAVDLEDLALRLKARMGAPEAYDLAVDLLGVERPILAMPALLPSVVLQAKSLGVVGFIVEQGTGLSHGAILARSFGLPAVRIPALAALEGLIGSRMLLDGNTGEVLVCPDDEEIVARVEPAAVPLPGERAAELPAQLWVSVVDPIQLEGFDWTGVEGVGLYRTEMLFLRHDHDFPGEAEQMEAYRRLFELADGRPVVVRTADLGADKPVAHMTFGPQDNPYLGLRAHRLYRFHAEIFITQVRAILRAAAGGHRLRLMFPMIESIDQWHFLQGLLDQAIASLRNEGLPFQADAPRGILVETPSAAWGFSTLLKVIDFASVGTNDLVQYLFAVERGAANVQDFYQPEHPIVLDVLATLADQAHRAGVPLSICGEVAGDPTLVGVLVGLGIDQLSLAPAAIARVRQQLRSLDLDEARQLAEACRRADTVDDVRSILGRTDLAAAECAPAVGRDQAVDPVCGMIVSTRDNPHLLRVGGVRHYFCSSRCMRRFLTSVRDGKAVVQAD